MDNVENVENPAAAEATELSDADFVRRSAARAPAGPPGPGLPESLLWTFGVLATQVLAGAAVFIAMIVVQIVAGGRPESVRDGMSGEWNVALLSGTQLIFVLVAIAAVLLRIRPEPLRKLGVAPIPAVHLVLIPCFLLPASLVSGQLYTWIMQVWEMLVEIAPALGAFDAFQSMETLTKFAEDASLSVLMATIVLAPAIGEELFFRGIIGRGLVARWGLPAGILLTSIFFAAVHLHPVHAVALVPLAVAFHLSYVATRSILAPMLLHGMNNSLAVVTTKLKHPLDVPGVEPTESLSVSLYSASVVCMLVVGVLAWKIRVQYRLPDGRVWNPGYPTVEPPPRELGAVRRCERTNGWLIAVAACCVVIFAGLLAYDMWAGTAT